MTTIAASVKDASIACDLQLTHNASGIKFKGAPKIIKLHESLSIDLLGTDTAYVGFCGSADMWGNLVMWFHNPTTKPPKCRDIEMLLLTGEKKIYHATNLSNWTYLDTKHFAIGSGMSFAMTAMECGKTPLEACKIASKFDISTGMGFKEFKL